jgi:hypothetical protein
MTIRQFPKSDFKIKFDAVSCMQFNYFSLSFDYEASLRPFDYCDPDPDYSWSANVARHEPFSFGIYVFSSLPPEFTVGAPLGYHYFSGEKDVGKQFINTVSDIVKKLSVIMQRNLPVRMTQQDLDVHASATRCVYCLVNFDEKTPKILHHCHLQGKYVAATCTACNNKLRKGSINCFVHNLSYDIMFFLKHLNLKPGKIQLLCKSMTKFISVTKFMHGQKVRFLDSCRLLPGTLDGWAKSMRKENFNFLRQEFGERAILLSEKLIFPYELVTEYSDLLKITEPPPIEKFYNHLKEEGVSPQEYDRFLKVWRLFNCKNLHEYSLLYMKIDVILLADILNHSRKEFMSRYKLDLLNFETASRFSYCAALLKSRISLDPVRNDEIWNFVYRGMRGGFSCISERYVEATNVEGEVNTHLVMYDANNLYGAVISKYPLPEDDFMFIDPSSIDILTCDLDGERGYIVEVSVDYPESLHDLHNAFPFLPVKQCPPGEKIPKLLMTLESKNYYVCHLRVLRQALEHGLVLREVHQVLTFKQSFWLKSYVDVNNEVRTNSTDENTKQLMKLLNNSLFGRLCLDVTKQKDFLYVTSAKELDKLIKKFNFNNRAILDENACIVEMNKRRVTVKSPFTTAMAILELSKVAMYAMYYDVAIPHFGEKNVSFVAGDTDSLMLKVKCLDLNAELLKLRDLHLDTSNYPVDHILYSNKNKGKLGYFKSESIEPILAFCGLRPKCYAILKKSHFICKSKGVGKSAIKKYLTFLKYKECLFGKKPLYTNFSTIQTKDFMLYTINHNKKSLCALDTKRIILDDNIQTLAYGHKDVK